MTWTRAEVLEYAKDALDLYVDARIGDGDTHLTAVAKTLAQISSALLDQEERAKKEQP